MSSLFIYPKPRDWAVLEDIVADVLSRKYRSYNLQRYGRSGQGQQGIDIVGPVMGRLIGIQCKHHPKGNISTDEIDKLIGKSEEFSPQPQELVIATSADRDITAHNHVLQISQQREAESKYPVSIKFWDDILDWLFDYPNLAYKHFTKYFPRQDFEHLNIPGLEDRNKHTVTWPTNRSTLTEAVTKSIGSIPRETPYNLTLGITDFPAIEFTDLVDVELHLDQLTTGESSVEAAFAQTAALLTEIKTTIADTAFSKQLFVRLQSRLSTAFLLGWVFRRVTHYNMILIFHDQVWSTNGLPEVVTNLHDALPEMWNSDSREIALYLSISRGIRDDVARTIETWDKRPYALLGLELDARGIDSAAQALSIAREISRKIKTYSDRWGMEKIHLFAAVPAALATLIAYHLNAIRPMSLYFMNESRNAYVLAGTLTNEL